MRHLTPGFEARIVEASGGIIQFTPCSGHNISMYLGPPMTIKYRRERHLQSRGAIDIVPMGYPIIWEDDGPARVLSISLSPSLIHVVAQRMGLDPAGIVLHPRLQVRDPHLEHICWGIVAEIDDGQAISGVYAESLALALAAHIVRRYVATEHHEEAMPLKRHLLNQVLHYIADHLDRDLSIETLASVAGLSPSHFKVVFREAMGTSVHRYVIVRRVDAAVRLLENGTPALEAAMQAGFANQSHMARLMRQTLGFTPRTCVHNRGLSGNSKADSKPALHVFEKL
jgi:AraC family transcriptional regulator